MFSPHLSKQNISRKKIYTVCLNTYSIYSSEQKQTSLFRMGTYVRCLYSPACSKETPLPLSLDAAKKASAIILRPPSEEKKKSSEMQPRGNTTLVCHPVTCTSHPSTGNLFHCSTHPTISGFYSF